MLQFTKRTMVIILLGCLCLFFWAGSAKCLMRERTRPFDCATIPWTQIKNEAMDVITAPSPGEGSLVEIDESTIRAHPGLRTFANLAGKSMQVRFFKIDNGGGIEAMLINFTDRNFYSDVFWSLYVFPNDGDVENDFRREVRPERYERCFTGVFVVRSAMLR